MSRLPTPGGDSGTWGAILNDFLAVSLNSDGTLKSGVVGDAQITDVTQAKVTGLSTSLAAKANDSSVLHNTGDNAGTLTNAASTNGFLTVNLNYSATGSTPDSLAFYYNGVRTGYHNEKGEIRARPAADNSVPFRVQQRSTSQSVNLTEWTQADNTVLASVGPTGIISAPNVDRKVSYGASQPSNPSVGDLWVQP
jgi:hypothetical protein